MEMTDLITRVRREIGDSGEDFRDTALGDGETVWFDLSKTFINESALLVQVVDGAQVLTLDPGSQYTTDATHGQVQLTGPVTSGATLLIQGQAYALMSDDEICVYLQDAVHQHCFRQTLQERYRDRYGFITYRDTPKELDNLPRIEEPLVVMLSTINLFWVLANDAAIDVNVQTAEGTAVDRGARYRQLMEAIGALQERYERYCGQLNVGAFRTETLNLRRVSRTTGRLVPLFKDREYDDHRYPVRQIPPIDHQDEDDSGVPSPLWNGQGF